MHCSTSSPKKQALTLKEIAEMDVAVLVPSQVAYLLDCHPYTLTKMAETPAGRQKLGFPITRIGTRTKIPRIPFLHFMGWTGKINGEEHTA